MLLEAAAAVMKVILLCPVRETCLGLRELLHQSDQTSQEQHIKTHV